MTNYDRADYGYGHPGGDFSAGIAGQAVSEETGAMPGQQDSDQSGTVEQIGQVQAWLIAN